MNTSEARIRSEVPLGQGLGAREKRRHCLRELHLGREERIGPPGDKRGIDKEALVGRTGSEEPRMEEGCWSAEATLMPWNPLVAPSGWEQSPAEVASLHCPPPPPRGPGMIRVHT